MTAIAKLDLALKLLDEVDATPLGQINTKLDRITDAVSAARRELTERNNNQDQYGATLDAVRGIVGSDQYV
ncbi:hypothetical protein ACWX0K_20525 [Nitrobacteraceae bacterium UC4446_H13]